PDLEADARMEKLAGQMAIGHDVEFFHFDLTNTCWTRSFYSDAGTMLLMCQISDMEGETYGPALRAVCASLQVGAECWKDGDSPISCCSFVSFDYLNKRTCPLVTIFPSFTTFLLFMVAEAQPLTIIFPSCRFATLRPRAHLGEFFLSPGSPT